MGGVKLSVDENRCEIPVDTVPSTRGSERISRISAVAAQRAIKA